MSDWDRQTTPGAVEGPQWVSAAEAADVAGVTPGTVRYWARNGLIVSEIVEGPAGEKTLVRLDEVMQLARREEPGRHSMPGSRTAAAPAEEVVTDLPARTSDLAPILKSIPEIMAQLTAATDRAARAETKVEFLSAQVSDLRRKLAEAEAGDGSTTVTLPESWETPAERPPAIAAEPAPSPTGWPAPPPGTPRQVPVEEPEPGPESIDWTTGAGGDELEHPAPAPAAEPPAQDATRSDFSLDDIWNQPATPVRETRPEPDPEPEPGPEDLDWHEPVGASSQSHEQPEAEPRPPRPANATIPDDDFYGPRRRRWFKRRK